MINWNTDNLSINGTSLQGYLDNVPWSFEETVARLLTLTNQPAQEQGDQEKVSVEFLGTYKGKVFTLYDYKEDFQIHIGGKSDLDVEGLREELLRQLETVEPTPYRARMWYGDSDAGHHEWTGQEER